MGCWFRLPSTIKGYQADLAYEFINWFLSGWAGAYLNRQGYYSAVLSAAKANMEAYEWDYWMLGKPAAKDIMSPNGQKPRRPVRFVMVALTRIGWAASLAGTP